MFCEFNRKFKHTKKIAQNVFLFFLPIYVKLTFYRVYILTLKYADIIKPHVFT